MRKIAFVLLLFIVTAAHSQQNSSRLTIEKIMRDPKWIGSSPSNPYWSADSKYLLFSWNPDKKVTDSVYYITPTSLTPQKTNYEFRQHLLTENAIRAACEIKFKPATKAGKEVSQWVTLQYTFRLANSSIFGA